MARSSGSRSSSVVVVMNAWGSAAIRRTRCDRRSGSSSEKTSSRSRSGGRPSIAVMTSSSASFRARIAVRCWPREANVARSRPPSSNTRSSRCGPTSVDPFQTSFSAVSASRRARASRADSPGSGGALVAYRSVSRSAAASSGAISAWAAARGSASVSRRRRRSVDDRPARIEERAVPEAQLVARRALLADRPQEAVALLERPAVGREGVGVGGRAGRRELVQHRPTERRRPGDEEHLLRREDDDPQDPRQPGRPTAQLVDPDALAAGRAVGARRDDRDLDRVRPDRRPRPARGPCPSGSARRRRSSGASGPRPAAPSPRAGSSCRPRSGRR